MATTKRLTVRVRDPKGRIEEFQRNITAGLYDGLDSDQVAAVVEGVTTDLKYEIIPLVHSRKALFAAVVVFGCIIGVGLIVLWRVV